MPLNEIWYGAQASPETAAGYSRRSRLPPKARTYHRPRLPGPFPPRRGGGQPASAPGSSRMCGTSSDRSSLSSRSSSNGSSVRFLRRTLRLRGDCLRTDIGRSSLVRVHGCASRTQTKIRTPISWPVWGPIRGDSLCGQVAQKSDPRRSYSRVARFVRKNKDPRQGLRDRRTDPAPIGSVGRSSVSRPAFSPRVRPLKKTNGPLLCWVQAANHASRFRNRAAFP